MHRWFALLAVSLLFTAISVAQQLSMQRARALAQEGARAYQEEQFDDARKAFLSALALRPDHPTLMYNVAAMSALAGHVASSLQYLDTVAAMGLTYAPQSDSDFVSLFDEDAFASVVRRFQENARPTERTRESFRVKPAGIVTEGIAFDPVSQRFFVGSVRVPSIMQRTSENPPVRLSRASDNLWSVLGMAVDARKRLLWVCTAALPQTEGLSPGDAGRTALLSYDLESGFLMRRVILADTTRAHVLGDVIVSDNGDVYATDSRSPAVYRMTTSERTLQPFLESPEFVSLQGMAFSEDGSTLYLADYSRGLFIVELSSKRITLHPPIPNRTLLGIDGLNAFGSSLIAIQNGVNPQRVIRLNLSSNGNAIESCEILASNEADFAEPTLGVVVGSDYYFNAASQWDLIGERGSLKANAAPRDHVILSLPLRK